MTNQVYALIKILSDGQYHSGEALGKELDISRTAIWKIMNQLGQYGIYCQRLHGQGYCIPGGIEFLDEQLIQSQLNFDVKKMISKMDFHLSVDSTNQSLMARIKQGALPVLVSTAEHQTQGRGRRGRHWQSPFGKNIYLSFSWSFLDGPSKTAGLTLAIGLGIVEVLEHFGICDLGLKWPNDVLWQGKKLAGVLTEMHMDSLGVCHVVIGLGINVDLPKQAKADICQESVDLLQILNKRISRNTLFVALMNHLISLVSKFNEDGFSSFEKGWEKYDLLKNQQVMLRLMEHKIFGKALGIDCDGGLKVQHEDTVTTYHAGEISIRKKEENYEFID